VNNTQAGLQRTLKYIRLNQTAFSKTNGEMQFHAGVPVINTAHLLNFYDNYI